VLPIFMEIRLTEKPDGRTYDRAQNNFQRHDGLSSYITF
jgi:hypothetical protein